MFFLNELSKHENETKMGVNNIAQPTLAWRVFGKVGLITLTYCHYMTTNVHMQSPLQAVVGSLAMLPWHFAACHRVNMLFLLASSP